MWFNRKSRNRRLNGGTVLDVKLRSDQARATRSRALALGLGVTFGTVFCFYLLWRAGEWALNAMIYENPAFAITHVDVQTDGVIAPDQIRRWAGTKAGDNLMALDLADIKRNLQLVSVIDSVTVERVLPKTLCIRVVEREAVAQVNVPKMRVGGGLDVSVLHFDMNGYVMLPLDPRLRSTPLGQVQDELPVITGVNPTALVLGKQIDSAQVRSAVELLARFQDSAMVARVDIKRVDVTTPDMLVATTDQGGAITFGVQNLDQQLLRWHEIYEQGMRHSKVIASLDLAVSNNIPARWLEANLVPPPAPKASRITRNNRKKHV
jgi:cell division septal protein FtsQ